MSMNIYNIHSFLFIIVYIVCIMIWDRFNIKTNMAAVYMMTDKL